MLTTLTTDHLGLIGSLLHTRFLFVPKPTMTTNSHDALLNTIPDDKPMQSEKMHVSNPVLGNKTLRGYLQRFFLEKEHQTTVGEWGSPKTTTFGAFRIRKA